MVSKDLPFPISERIIKQRIVKEYLWDKQNN